MEFLTDCLDSAGFTRTKDHIQGVITSRCKNVKSFFTNKRLYISLLNIQYYNQHCNALSNFLLCIFSLWHVIYDAIIYIWILTVITWTVGHVLLDIPVWIVYRLICQEKKPIFFLYNVFAHHVISKRYCSMILKLFYYRCTKLLSTLKVFH